MLSMNIIFNVSFKQIHPYGNDFKSVNLYRLQKIISFLHPRNNNEQEEFKMNIFHKRIKSLIFYTTVLVQF